MDQPPVTWTVTNRHSTFDTMLLADGMVLRTSAEARVRRKEAVSRPGRIRLNQGWGCDATTSPRQVRADDHRSRIPERVGESRDLR